ncbi:MAG: patatin-like phospholipase family protein [Gammaproteobacteria bacterium]
MEWKVDIDSRTSAGILDGNQTSLHLAAYKGQSDVVKLLLKLGADIDARNQNKKTASDIAIGSSKLLLRPKMPLLNSGQGAQSPSVDRDLIYSKLINHISNEVDVHTYLKNEYIQSANLLELYKIENLVFAGGGVRGQAYYGALKVLFNNDLNDNSRFSIKLEQIKRVGGASAGAITAFFIALGYDLNELGRLINNLQFKNLLEEDLEEDSKDIKKIIQGENKNFDIGNWNLKSTFFKLKSISESVLGDTLDAELRKENLHSIYIAGYFVYAVFRRLGHDLYDKNKEEIKKKLINASNDNKKVYKWFLLLTINLSIIPVSVITSLKKGKFAWVTLEEIIGYILDKGKIYLEEAIELLANSILSYNSTKRLILTRFFRDNEKDLENFNTSFYYCLNVIYAKNGLFEGKIITKWLGEQLKNRFQSHLNEKIENIEDVTFQELYQLRGQFANLKELQVVALNLSTGFTQVFSHKKTPTVVVRDAIRASISIPIFFQPYPVRCKAANGKFEPYSFTSANNDGTSERIPFLFTDGGVIDNYPIWLFDKKDFLSENFYNKNHSYFNDKTLGFRLVGPSRKNLFENKKIVESNIGIDANFPSYAGNFVNSVWNKEDSDHYRTKDRKRTIYIDTGTIDTVKFDLTDKDKSDLSTFGSNGVYDFFSRKLKSAIKQLKSLNQFPIFPAPSLVTAENPIKVLSNLNQSEVLPEPSTSSSSTSRNSRRASDSNSQLFFPPSRGAWTQEDEVNSLKRKKEAILERGSNVARFYQDHGQFDKAIEVTQAVTNEDFIKVESFIKEWKSKKQVFTPRSP